MQGSPHILNSARLNMFEWVHKQIHWGLQNWRKGQSFHYPKELQVHHRWTRAVPYAKDHCLICRWSIRLNWDWGTDQNLSNAATRVEYWIYCNFPRVLLRSKKTHGSRYNPIRRNLYHSLELQKFLWLAWQKIWASLGRSAHAKWEPEPSILWIWWRQDNYFVKRSMGSWQVQS